MEHSEFHLFLSIAEIAGVFVGFGALIGVARELALEARNELLSVVGIGLVVLVGALLPVWLDLYGLSERALWVWASVALLLLIWVAMVGILMDDRFRRWLLADLKANPGRNVIFFLCLEGPIQGALILAILGVAPALDQAFYVTALVLNLSEAAFMLARLVFARQPGVRE